MTSLVRSAGATSRPAATSDQSVLMRTPRTMPSRSGPRKPGHSTRAESWLAHGEHRRLRRGWLPESSQAPWLQSERLARLDCRRWSRPVASESPPSVPAAAAADSSLAWARSRCSGVGVHRQSELRPGDVASHAFCAHERPHAAREQDDRHQRRASSSAGEATAGPRPRRRGRGSGRGPPRRRAASPSAPGNRLVDDARRREQPDDRSG